MISISQIDVCIYMLGMGLIIKNQNNFIANLNEIFIISVK